MTSCMAFTDVSPAGRELGAWVDPSIIEDAESPGSSFRLTKAVAPGFAQPSARACTL